MATNLKTNGEILPFHSFPDILLHYPLPTILLDIPKLEIISFNQPAAELFSKQELSGIFFPGLFTEENRIHLIHQLQSANGSHHCLESLLDNNGERKALQIHLSFIENSGKDFWIASMVDVSSQRELSEEIKKFRTYIERSSEGIYCQEFLQAIPVDLDAIEIVERIKSNSILTECNDAMARKYGFEKVDQLKGLVLEQVIDFSDPANIGFLQQFITNGFTTINAESHEKDRFGNLKYFLNNAIGIVEDGKLKRIWGTQQDITDRKKTEEKSRQLASLVEQTSDILTAADINYMPVSWNKAAEEVYGITAQQAIGNDLRNFISIHYTGANREEVRKIIAEKGEWRGEVYFVRPSDNKTIHLWMCFKKMLDEKEKHIGYLVSAIDITERKESESRLAESENRFREMANCSPVMIWMSDEKNKITYLNQKWIDFTGSNIVGKDGNSWSALVHKDDLALALATYHKAFHARKQVTLIYRLLSIDGSYRWVHDVSVPRFLDDGTFVGYIGSVVDIQDEKQKEQQLLYQAMILDNVSDVIVTTDVDFRIRSWNRIAEEYYGAEEASVVGKKISELVDFEFYDTSLEDVIKDLLNKDNWSGEASFVTKKGETKYFHYALKGIYDENHIKIGYLSTGRDITEKKLADEQVKKSEQFYRTLIADSLDGMILLDKEGQISFASPSVKNVLGYEVEEIIGRNAFEFVHGEDLIWALQSFEKEVVEKPDIKFIVIRLKKKNGEWMWSMVRGHNLLKNPYVSSIVVYFHDDTLRKQANDALKESEKKFRSLVKDLKVGVFLADNKGTILMCNQALSVLLGAPEEYIVGKRIYDILTDDMIDEKGKKIALEHRPLTQAIQLRKTVKDKVVGVIHPVTGERSWIMVNADPMLDEQDEIRHIVCSVMDLTERKKLEHQLVNEQVGHQKQLAQATIDGQEAERKEIGKELHDNIGQQLTTIKLFLDLAKSTADDATQEMVSMALKGVADVINEIRAMSRTLVPSTLQDLGLIESINELVDSIERTQVITIDVNYDGFEENSLPENQKLALYRIVQEQLNNIVKHANATHVSIVLNEKKGRSVLEIRDDGCGFDPRKLRKGLGLTNMKNRAELLGGKNEILSQPGKGCLLRVSLPLVNPATDGILANG